MKSFPVTRPVLVDERDGVCETCARHKVGLCDECERKIATYENMNGLGYQSPTPSHFHLTQVSGVQGRAAMYQELCLECYRKAFKSAYPSEKVPV